MRKCFCCKSVIFLSEEIDVIPLAPPQYMFSAAVAINSSYSDQNVMIQATELLCNKNDFSV